MLATQQISQSLDDHEPAGDQPTVVTWPGNDTKPASVWVIYGVTTENVSLQHWYAAARGAEVTGLGSVGTFSSQQVVPTPSGYQNWGDVAIGPAGQVIITYENSVTTTGPEDLYTALDDDGLGPHGFAVEVFATSTNVGANAVIPADPRHKIGSDPTLAWDRRTSTSRPAGRLYLLYVGRATTTTDDTDIYLRHSDDDGATWSSLVRVNDDTTSTSQFLPRIALDDDTGYVGVAWYDCRQDTANNTAAHFYLTVSTNGGDTFLPNTQVSTGASNPGTTIETAAYGDYAGLAFIGGSLFPAWADNSNSTGDNPGPGSGGYWKYDVYTARVNLTPSLGESVTLTGASGDDDLSVSLDPSGTFVQFWDSANHTGRPAFTASLAAISSITVDALAGDDALTLIRPAPLDPVNNPAPTGVPLSLTSPSLGIDSLIIDHSNIEHCAFSLSAGAYTLDTDNASWTPLAISLDNDASLTFASTQHLASFTLADTATATIADDLSAPDTARVLFAGTLALDPAASLDIGLNALVADAPDSASLSLLAGYFAGHQITTSASSVTNGFLLGVHGPLDLTAASDHPLGILVSSDQVLFRYTTLGDATGDGVVDASDLNAVLNNIGYSEAQHTFHLGDTNDDGVVDLNDLNNVLNNFGNTIFIT